MRRKTTDGRGKSPGTRQNWYTGTQNLTADGSKTISFRVPVAQYDRLKAIPDWQIKLRQILPSLMDNWESS